MNSGRLYDILQDTTQVYRKGAEVEERQVGGVRVVEVFGYPHTSESQESKRYEKVDVVFVDIVVDKEKARQYKRELEDLLMGYPEPERLAGGPSYIELAPNLGLEQESAFRLMALGETLGFWKIMSGKSFGLGDQEALELAGQGLLMISGYKPRGEK